MWLIDYFDPGCVAYNIPVAYLAEGPFDTAALQTAVDQMLVRHETLRTSFYEEDGDLFQRVENEVTARVEMTDISHVSEANRDQALETLIREQARRSFDLSHAPMVRFHLFRLADQRHVVFFNIHHIIADRRSLGILRDELSTLYQAAVQKQAATLPNFLSNMRTTRCGRQSIWPMVECRSKPTIGRRSLRHCLPIWNYRTTATILKNVLRGGKLLRLRLTRPCGIH